MREYYSPQLNRWIIYFNRNHRVYRYRHMMEQHLGRPLERSEHVHHLNGDPTDDRIENLVVVSAKEHRAYHAEDIPAWAHKGWQYTWSRDYPCCIECGTTERKHTGHGQCSRCYFRNLNRMKRGHSPRVPAVVVTKTCPNCGEEFTRRGTDKLTMFCSKRCAGKGMAAQIWATRRANGTDRGYKKRKATAR